MASESNVTPGNQQLLADGGICTKALGLSNSTRRFAVASLSNAEQAQKPSLNLAGSR
jgi:hypothetical protein